MLDKLHKAKIDLALTHPFFGVLLMKLKLTEDNTQETFYTDGKVIGYNADFANSKTTLELKTILCHEVLHVACLHPWRRNHRDNEKWNVAADYAINGILEKNQFLMPTDALLDPTYTGQCAEEIYHRLPNKPKDQNGQGTTQDKSGFGDVRDYPSQSESDFTQASFDMEIASKYAEKMAKGYGADSGLGTDIASAKSTVMDWPNLLRQYMTQTCKADYSFARPNRRYIAQGLYLPDLHSREMGTVVIAIDTSASVAQDELNRFFTEVNSIIQEVQPSNTVVIQCDSKVKAYDEFGKGEIPTPNIIGRGGTSFAPVFQRVQDEGLTPACLIYLTDLDACWSEITVGLIPDYPVIWVSTDRHRTAPLGDTVYL